MNFKQRSLVLVATWAMLSPLVATASDKETQKLLALQNQNDSKGAPAANSKATSASSPIERSAKENMSAEMETSILEFVKHEQAQLFELLQYLKQKQPTSYQQALRETGRTKQRLESLKEKDAEMYAIESQLWLTKSKLNLLAAQMSLRDDSDLQRQLETLVADQEAQEIARLTLMRDRTAKQLEKWNSQLNDRTSNSSVLVEKNLEGWKNRIKKQKNSRKSLPGPAE